MKFDVVVGNPPYQGDAKQQIYVDFYLMSISIGHFVSLIFPIGWQEPKNANNLSKMNTKAVKEDCHIISVDNRQNVFPGVMGAEWTNIIMWSDLYDNGLSGHQNLYINGVFDKTVKFLTDKNDILKPQPLLDLEMCVINHGDFLSLQNETSKRKPYGLSTDILKDVSKCDALGSSDEVTFNDDIAVWYIGKNGRSIKYLPATYEFSKKSPRLDKYKVFVPYAWGNWSDQIVGLGGAYSNIIIGSPREATTETFLESGCFDNKTMAGYHAKYLMTRFVRGLLYLNKYSQHSTTAWGAIPVQDYSEAWWDESIEDLEIRLFDKYHVPDNVRDFVLTNIQQKTEANIINYK